jgi:two-component SAPR family response regulator
MPGPQRHRVLVLEDEWIIAEQIETALEEAGYEVVGPVGRMDAALALLKGQAVDAAVLDINVHGDRSFRAAVKLAQAEIPFVFLSGYAETALPAELSDRPLMQKPVDAIALCRCIDALVRSPNRKTARAKPGC